MARDGEEWVPVCHLILIDCFPFHSWFDFFNNGTSNTDQGDSSQLSTRIYPGTWQLSCQSLVGLLFFTISSSYSISSSSSPSSHDLNSQVQKLTAHFCRQNSNPDPAKWDQSYECFKDDIYRCHQLGIKLYNWHPGSTVGACSREESYALLAKAINRVHTEVPDVICVIENMVRVYFDIYQDIL